MTKVFPKGPTFQNPRCVLQMLKAHYSRYDLERCLDTGTPWMISRRSMNSTPRRALGIKSVRNSTLWVGRSTQWVTNIRTMAIIQSLLGNMGVAGGESTLCAGSQTSRDRPTRQYCRISSGISQGAVASLATLDEYLKMNTPKTNEPQSANWYQNTPKYMVSLLKAWYGDKAVKGNDFAYSYLPKLDDGQDATVLNMIDRMYEGKVKGFTCVGQDPACSLPNANKVRQAFAKLDWMVHINIFDNERVLLERPGMNPKRSKRRSSCFPPRRPWKKKAA